MRFDHLYAHPPVPGRASKGLAARAATPRPARVRIAERVLKAYRLAVAQESSAGFPREGADLWTELALKHMAGIMSILESGSAEALAGALERFGEAFTQFGGLSLGLDGYRASRDGSALAFLYVDKLACLAEAVGAITLENPEQGVWGESAYRDVDELVARTEAALGISILPPEGIVHTVGVPCAKGTIHYRHLNAVYAAWRAASLAGRQGRVCEYGGGLGLVPMYARRLGIEDYTLLDLPITNAFAGNFLLHALGEEAVRLFGEPEAPRKVQVLPYWCCAEQPGKRFDLSLNQDSFPEIDPGVVRRYLAEIARTTTRHFLSINQEAQAPMAPGRGQGCVMRMLEGDARFRRVQRSPYWLRSGYVEELYEVL